MVYRPVSFKEAPRAQMETPVPPVFGKERYENKVGLCPFAPSSPFVPFVLL